MIIIAILLIFEDSLAFSLFGNEKLIRYFLFFVVISIFFYLLIVKKSIKLHSNSLYTFLFLIILIFANIIINQDVTLGYLYICMLMSMGFVASQMISFDEFIEDSIQCMFFLAIYSIISYILRPFIFNYRAIFPHFFNASGIPMFHLGASVIIDSSSYYRLFGIFRESGVYQIFLNIAILFELFLRNKETRVIYIRVFLITVVLTFSTPGYFGAFILLFTYIVFNRSNVEKTAKKKIVHFILIILVFALLIYNISPELLQNFDVALSKFFNKESSYVGRTTSILVEFKLWSERPLFGYGITKGIALSKYYGSIILGEFMYNTSTFTGMLVTLGGIFTIVISLMLIKFVWLIRSNYLVKLLILSAVVLIFSSQLMMYNAYLYGLLFFGLVKKEKKNIQI